MINVQRLIPNFVPELPDNNCCEELCDRVCDAVCDFFENICTYISDAAAWTCNKIAALLNSCFACCDESEEIPPGPVLDRILAGEPRNGQDIVQDPLLNDVRGALARMRELAHNARQKDLPEAAANEPLENMPPLDEMLLNLSPAEARKIFLDRAELLQNAPLKCAKNVLEFDLDTALDAYKDAPFPKNFEDLYDFAYPEQVKDNLADLPPLFDEKKDQFKQIFKDHELNGYRIFNGTVYRPELADKVKLRLSQLYAILSQEIIKLGPDPDVKKSKELQLLIGSTITRIMQAHTDGCIVQTNSQMENICADILVHINKEKDPRNQLQSMAGLSIYKYRRAMVASLVHVTIDWLENVNAEVYNEEAVLALVSGKRPPNPNFNTFGNRTKADQFKREFTSPPRQGEIDKRPEAHLMRALSDPYGANLDVGTLRDDLRTFAINYFGLLNEDGEVEEADSLDPAINESILEKRKMIALLSGKKDKTKKEIDAGAPDEDGDAFSIMANTGNFSVIGAKLLLEIAGIFQTQNIKDHQQ